MAQELLLALLHRDGVDDALALHALEAGNNRVPARRVNHHRDLRDLRLRRDEVEELRHALLGVEHALVHVDVDDLRAALNLLPGDAYRLIVLLLLDEAPELRRARDVGPLAHVHEERVIGDVERLKPGEAAGSIMLMRHARRNSGDSLSLGPDVIRRRAAAASDDVHEP